MSKKKPIPAANIRAVNNYIRRNYERIGVLAEPGTKEAIREAARPGESVNSFINAAIRAELERRAEGRAADLEGPEQPERPEEVKPLI